MITVINNNIRSDLKLSFSEYAMAIAIHEKFGDKVFIANEHGDYIKKTIKISSEEYKLIGKGLKNKNILISNGADFQYILSEAWKDHFRDDVEEFEKFWKDWSNQFNNPGNKQRARKAWVKVMKVASIDFLYEQKDEYRVFLNDYEDQEELNLSTWLNPINKVYENFNK